jgi:hypothetical protein
MRIPAVTLSEPDPTELISTGDWVKVDADREIVAIIRQRQDGSSLRSASQNIQKIAP